MDDVELLQQNGDEVHVGLFSVPSRGGEVESVENVGEGDDAGWIADVDGEERTLDLSEEIQAQYLKWLKKLIDLLYRQLQK